MNKDASSIANGHIMRGSDTIGDRDTIKFIEMRDGPEIEVTAIYPDLRECIDPLLQSGLDKIINYLDLQNAVANKKLAIALVDITDPMKPKNAMINGNNMMYAASLPKIAILLSVFEKIKQGEMQWSHQIQESLTKMIKQSSNNAASQLFDAVSGPYIAKVLQSAKYRLYDTTDNNGGLWVGKPYGKRAAWKRDPLHNKSHGATALQTARFYYMLETKRLVSYNISGMIKDVMANSTIQHKFVRGLKSRPEVRIYRKSGTWRTWHADSAIIERNDRKYIAVVLANSMHGEKWIQKLIVEMDDLILFNHAANIAKL